jgi:hypothetical protein
MPRVNKHVLVVKVIGDFKMLMGVREDWETGVTEVI